MNDIFNIRRFGKYLASDARSCAANYGLSMLLISLMGVIIYAGTVIIGLLFTGKWGGPELSFRTFTFAVSVFCLMVTMPVKCYGQITEKRFGTQWLMIPASGFEKFLSMIIMTVVVIPVISCTIYLGTDAILCALDGTCGTGIFASFRSMINGFMEISFASSSDMARFPELAHFVKQVSNPWLYVDDIIGMLLIFLTGAIIFKKSKTSKTILAYIALTAVLGMIATPFAKTFFNNFSDMAFTAETPEALNQLFDMGIFRHAALIDTINDTLVNLALMTVIYFRIKTLKH